jgi:serine/threonine-protein kinase RsbW
MKDIIKFGFASYIANLNLIDDIFESLGSIYGISESIIYDIILITREAAVNSIKHAYKSRTGMIDIIIEISGNQSKHMNLTIRDHGKGFDLEKIPDPLISENLLKPSGRGILLIKKLSDECSIESSQEDGTSIYIKKYI